VHADIKNSFGGNGGVEEFKQMWNLEQEDSRVREELAKVLGLGGTFDRSGAFTAPYTFSRWPAGTDPYGFVAIIGKDVGR
jgi:hypothetical protein